MGKDYFKNMNLVRESTYFKTISKHTKHCASCGENFVMSNSTHSHLPFCDKCRGDIIKKEFGTVEKKPKQMELKEKLGKDFIDGLKGGLQIAKDVCKSNGYEITFPDVKDMKLEEVKEHIEKRS